MGNCTSGSGVATGPRPRLEAKPLPRSFAGTVETCRGGTVVLSGCGGGYDVIGSAPLLHHLDKIASDVILANLTFTNPSLLRKFGEELPGCRFVRRIDPGSFANGQDRNPYFPEALFANAVKRPVYAISRDASIADVTTAYRKIMAAHKCKRARAIFLAKGGSDLLFADDETGNSVPAEDMVHLRSAMAVPAEHRAVLALGLDINCGSGIEPSEVDDRLEQLRDSAAVHFEEQLSLDRDDARYYRDVVEKCDPAKTVIQSLVCSAIEGKRHCFTPEHLVQRIQRNTAPLTDRSATLFGFDMESVAAGVKYLDRLPETSDVRGVRLSVNAFKDESFKRRQDWAKEGEGDALEKSSHTGKRTPLPPLPEEAPIASQDIALSA